MIIKTYKSLRYNEFNKIAIFLKELFISMVLDLTNISGKLQQDKPYNPIDLGSFFSWLIDFRK